LDLNKTKKTMLDLLLDKITKEFPDWQKSCIKNVLLLSLCMIQNETTCLYKLKNKVGLFIDKPETKKGSHYKRLTRIFTGYAFSRLWIALLSYVFRSLRLKSDYLLLDGTSWDKGKTRLHYITLCVVYGGVAIPIYWEDLRKKGISNQKERIKLLKKAMKYFNLEGKTLLADREYIGTDWFKFLKNNGIEFNIRLRTKSYKDAINASSGKSYEELSAKALRSKKRAKAVGKRITLDGMELMFIVVKNPKPNAKDELIYLLSSLDKAPAVLSVMYLIRWQIETCFKHLKSNGFDLEKANVKGKARQKLLMAIVVFSYTLAITEGLKDYGKIPYKTYPNGKVYKAISLFRHGLDKLVNLCSDFTQYCTYLIHELHDKLPTYRSRKSIFV